MNKIERLVKYFNNIFVDKPNSRNKKRLMMRQSLYK